MESSEASWHCSFDPSVAAEDSEAMARLLGVHGCCFGGDDNGQIKQPAPAPPSSSSCMYWPGNEADDHGQYYGGAAVPAPYYVQEQQHASAVGYQQCHAGGYYDGVATMGGAGEFFVAPDDAQMADDPGLGFMVDLNIQFEDPLDDGNASSGCKRKLGDTGAGSKKKARSTATPPVSPCHL